MHDVETDSLSKDFTDITRLLLTGRKVQREGLERLLASQDTSELDTLYSLARKMRHRHFGDRVFLYGFIYFSTYCRNNCNFCTFRKSNNSALRYRKTPEDILAAATQLLDDNVHLIDLTMGEDPEMYTPGNAAFNKLLATIANMQKAIGLPVMLSPGALTDSSLARIAEHDICWYACYQETHNRNHFSKLRRGQDYTYRINRKRKAHQLGMLTEEGILLGAGETITDIADSLLWMKNNPIDQVRVMTFIPQHDNTRVNHHPGTQVKEETVIAVMRLLMPERLIPASLDIDGLAGLPARLNSGANVVTSIIPAQSGLSGVANSSLNIEDEGRTVGKILPVLQRCGLHPASRQEYSDWVHHRRSTIAKIPVQHDGS